MINLKLLKN